MPEPKITWAQSAKEAAFATGPIGLLAGFLFLMLWVGAHLVRAGYPNALFGEAFLFIFALLMVV